MNSKANSTFQKAVEEHYADLYRFAYSLCKNEHQASDFTQQTYSIYAKKGQSLRDNSKTKPWLFTTLYREFLRQQRKSQRLEIQDPTLLEEVVPVPTTPSHDQLDHQRIMAALERLELRYREPLSLYYLRNLTYQEIADVLGIPMGTVMSRISRGKCKLKEIFLETKDLPDS